MFNNALIYMFTKDTDPLDGLEEKLATRPIGPCGPQDSARIGWCEPLAGQASLTFSATHTTGQAHPPVMICLQRNEKVLPNDVVRKEVDGQVRAEEKAIGRPLRRKERNEIKEQVLLEMMPKAFERSRYTYAYLWPSEGYVVVQGTPSAAETLLSELRETLGTLPVRPVSVMISPGFVFSQWVRGDVQPPAPLAIAERCRMKGADSEDAAFRNINLYHDEVRAHLDQGMEVVEIEVNWGDYLRFIVTDELRFKGIKMGEELMTRLDEQDDETAEDRMRTKFWLFSQTLNHVFRNLTEDLGGIDRSAFSQ